MPENHNLRPNYQEYGNQLRDMLAVDQGELPRRRADYADSA